jgi:AraC family transcriptional regulator
VFLHAGPYKAFGQTYDRIFKGWLTQSGERLREEPCFELYLNNPGDTKPEDLRTEIWLPIA